MRSPDEAKRNPGAGVKEAEPFPDCGRRSPASIRATIVAAARSWIGTPYRHQGALKGVGCDCLGLLVGVWHEVRPPCDAARLDRELRIPPYTPDWAEAAGRETFAEGLGDWLEEIDMAEAREGDIVLFRWRAHLPAKHAGILTARDRMVHAQEGARVAEVALSAWWRRRVAFGFSVTGAHGVQFAATAQSDELPAPLPTLR
jgi:NlpC/P60 family putative phage cell wall peptidase